MSCTLSDPGVSASAPQTCSLARSSNSDDVLCLTVLSSFTWPDTAQRFSFNARRAEKGASLKRRLAAYIGYLALDITLYTSGALLRDDLYLADQGLRQGDEVRICRRTILPEAAGILPAGCESLPTSASAAVLTALTPASSTLERYCRSSFALSCMDAMPGAPVLHRMLLLDHGFVPNLQARCALQHAIPAPGMRTMLSLIGVLPARAHELSELVSDSRPTIASQATAWADTNVAVGGHPTGDGGTEDMRVAAAAADAAVAAAALLAAHAPATRLAPTVRKAASAAAAAASAAAAAAASCVHPIAPTSKSCLVSTAKGPSESAGSESHLLAASARIGACEGTARSPVQSVAECTHGVIGGAADPLFGDNAKASVLGDESDDNDMFDCGPLRPFYSMDEIHSGAMRARPLSSATHVDWLGHSTVISGLPSGSPRANSPLLGPGNPLKTLSGLHGGNGKGSIRSTSDRSLSTSGCPSGEVVVQSMFRSPGNIETAIEIDEIFAFLDWDAESASSTSNASPETPSEMRLSPVLPTSASIVVNSNGAPRRTDGELDRSRSKDVHAKPHAIAMDDVPARSVYWQISGGLRAGDTLPQRVMDTWTVEQPSLLVNRLNVNQPASKESQLSKRRHELALPDELRQKRQHQMQAKGHWAGGAQSALCDEKLVVRSASDGSRTGYASLDRDSDSNSVCGLSSADSSTLGAEYLSAVDAVLMGTPTYTDTGSYADDGVHLRSRLVVGVSRANTEETCSHRSGSVERSVSHERTEQQCEHLDWRSEHPSEEHSSISEGDIRSRDNTMNNARHEPPKRLTRGHRKLDGDSDGISACMVVSDQTRGSTAVNLAADGQSRSRSRRRHAAPRSSGITLSRWKR